MPDSVDGVAEGELEAARALHRAGKLDQARAAYERLLAATPDDADLLGLLGVVALQEQDFAAADEWFRRALEVADADPRIHLRNVNNLFVLLKAQGRTQAARELAGADLPDWPEDAPPNKTERGRLTSLAEALALYGQPDRALSLLERVLPLLREDPAALHLAGRLRLERGDALAALGHLRDAAARDPANWRILSALSVAYGQLRDGAAAREAAVRCGRAAPVYVAPRQDGQEATILVLNDMPLRHIAADSSSKLRHSENKTAALVHDADELRSFLERVNWPQFYVIQYVDLRKPDCNFRKLRATFAGDEIIMSRCQYDRDWMVGGVAGMEFYNEFPDLVAEIQRILGDPEATLGLHVMPVLAEIRHRIPLDLYGMDFDIDDDGRLVLFEVQATMTLVADAHAPDREITPKEPDERIAEAFRRLVRRKIAEGA